MRRQNTWGAVVQQVKDRVKRAKDEDIWIEIDDSAGSLGEVMEETQGLYGRGELTDIEIEGEVNPFCRAHDLGHELGAQVIG